MLDWFKSVLYVGLGPAIKFFATFGNPLGAAILGLWYLAQLVITNVNGLQVKYGSLSAAYTAMQTAVGDSVFLQLPAPLTATLRFLNAYMPITEALLLAGVASVMYVLSIAFRILKSWVPTMN